MPLDFHSTWADISTGAATTAGDNRLGHYEAIATGLPRGARDLLLEHIDGPNFITVPVVAGERAQSRTALLDRELIRYNTSSPRPVNTIITEAGRYVLAVVLAMYAERLVRAGYSVEAEVSSAVTEYASILYEEHVKDFQPPLDQFGASPSVAAASEPEPTVQPQRQTVACDVD